ncbi:DNA polymerase IV [Catenuloplanes atrovinosus]|uniref:DNA polymerase IV n=1 Tax=Catenuloplanes atrovinosus TaxID=137266 RepID=A0AAE3YS23_9ACTN|nr:DNA polymerase IV [Catenuloplanes atrovinosus]MDR7278182.1 DNA polymerase-4 [Catenuloplanes atrovinosus]
MGRSQSVGRERDPRFGADADDTGCPILHVDMDAFYPSVEIHRRPALRGKPVIVGGLGNRGVVSSASYEAREFGVRSAMPMTRARALCPHAVFLSPDFEAYTAASRAVMRILRDTTPLVEPLSLDEAFLDVGGARRLLGRPAEIAAKIRARVAGELGLTCTVGVAPTKFLAKLGSTRGKPDGLMVIPSGLVLEFLHPLPVAALWGVGERSAETLQRLGLRTVGDLAQAPISLLRSAVGEAAAAHLHELAWGRDPRAVQPEHVDKSIGAEVTFDTDLTDRGEIRKTMLALAGRVATRLRAAGHAGRTVSIKIRRADFQTLNRSRTLASPTDVAREIFDTAWALYAAMPHPGPLRLVGVRVEGLVDGASAARQPELGAPAHGWREAETAIDAAAARFGGAVIRPASLLGGADQRRPENPSRP